MGTDGGGQALAAEAWVAGVESGHNTEGESARRCGSRGVGAVAFRSTLGGAHEILVGLEAVGNKLRKRLSTAIWM